MLLRMPFDECLRRMVAPRGVAGTGNRNTPIGGVAVQNKPSIERLRRAVVHRRGGNSALNAAIWSALIMAGVSITNQVTVWLQGRRGQPSRCSGSTRPTAARQRLPRCPPNLSLLVAMYQRLAVCSSPGRRGTGWLALA